MTDEATQRKIDALAKKRDYAADVVGNMLLAWTYQKEIDNLLGVTDDFTDNVFLRCAAPTRGEGE